MSSDSARPDVFQRARRELLYHYTSQEGLLGILNKEELWATDVRFLNDISEFQAGLAMAKGMAIESSNGAGKDGATTVKWFMALLGSSFEEQPVFSVSFTGPLKSVEQAFSEADDPGDRLNMWRGYASRGINYSVGMEVKGEVQVDPLERVDLQECSYLESTKHEYLRPAMNEFGKLLNVCNRRRVEGVSNGIDPQRAMDEMRSGLDAGLPGILPDLKVQIELVSMIVSGRSANGGLPWLLRRMMGGCFTRPGALVSRHGLRFGFGDGSDYCRLDE